MLDILLDWLRTSCLGLAIVASGVILGYVVPYFAFHLRVQDGAIQWCLCGIEVASVRLSDITGIGIVRRSLLQLLQEKPNYRMWGVRLYFPGVFIQVILKNGRCRKLYIVTRAPARLVEQVREQIEVSPGRPIP